MEALETCGSRLHGRAPNPSPSPQVTRYHVLRRFGGVVLLLQFQTISEFLDIDVVGWLGIALDLDCQLQGFARFGEVSGFSILGG